MISQSLIIIISLDFSSEIINLVSRQLLSLEQLH